MNTISCGAANGTANFENCKLYHVSYGKTWRCGCKAADYLAFTSDGRIALRYISIFSGIEAASVAWEPLGWTPVAFCEVDEFPSAVLRERFPGVPNLGDITKVDWSAYRGAVDLVVGGSPCQSFSMAGKREGLAGASGLMWEYIRCVQEVMPEWLVWENVPGALSSERGWAFEQLLSSLDGIGYGLAWRVLDAQFFGVAQRRRRVFLVGHIGDMRASEVLFESESMCWGSPSSREKRQALARSAGRGAVPGRGDGCLNPWDVQSKRIFAADSCGPMLNSGTNEGMNIQPSVLQPMAFKYSAGAAAQTMPCYDDGSVNTLTADTRPPAAAHAITQYGDDMAGTLRASGGSPTPVSCECMVAHPLPQSYVLKVRGGSDTYIKHDGKTGTAGKGALVGDDCAFTIAATQDQTVLCMADDTANASVDVDVSGTLKVGGGGSIGDDGIVQSNGQTLVGALCAADAKQTGNQFVSDGKVIACRVTHASPAP